MAQDSGGSAAHAESSPGDAGNDRPTLEVTAYLALALPEVTAGQRRGTRTWSVHGRCFAWERPFTKADLGRFGATPPPDGPIVAVRVADLGEKEAVLAAQRAGVFTIPHFDGFAAVLLALPQVATSDLHDALIEAWLACAPPSLAEQYLRGG